MVLYANMLSAGISSVAKFISLEVKVSKLEGFFILFFVFFFFFLVMFIFCTADRTGNYDKEN